MTIFLLLIFLGYIYLGFYYPDPYQTAGRSSLQIRLLLWSLRILFPLLIAIILFFYIGVRSGRLNRFIPWAVVGSTLAAVLIFYPIANYLFERWYISNLDEFHPYLQLIPHQTHLREGDRSMRNIIMCLGGSTTEFVDQSGKGWEQRIETQLNDMLPDKTIEVYNEGRQWYTTLHTLINYEENLRHLDPDVIIIMQTINDLIHNADFSYFSHGPFREDYGHFYGPVSRLIYRQSLFDFLNTTLKGFWYYTPRTIVDTDYFPGLISYERNLRTIIELAQRDSTNVVLMTEPFLFKNNPTKDESAALFMLNREAIGPDRQWSLQTAISGMNSYNDVVRKLAKEYHIVLIDLEHYVPKTLEYFVDEVHYTDKGFDLIGPYIANELAKNADHLFYSRSKR